MKPRTREAVATPGALAALGMESTPPENRDAGKDGGDPLVQVPRSAFRVCESDGHGAFDQARQLAPAALVPQSTCMFAKGLATQTVCAAPCRH